MSVVKIMLKVLITSAFQLLPFQARLRDVFFFQFHSKTVSHADDNNQEQSHRPPIRCSTHARPVGSGNKPGRGVPHSMFYFYAFLWSVNTPASYCKTLPSGAHFSIIFVPPISGIFLRSQNGSVAFSPENWKWGLIEGKTKASVEVCTSVLTRALISNKPLPPCAASFSCCSNGCFTRAWRV